jgi:tetratricopeptide (TPR) repeat protein
MSFVRSCLGICLIAIVAANGVPLLADAQAAVTPVRSSSLRRAAELEERGQFAQAEQIYLAQERLAPMNAEILFHLGTLRMRQNDWPKAIEYLGKCRRLEPRNADVLFYLAQAYYLNRELAPAQQTISIAARLAPGNAPVLQKAGEYLCDGGDCGPGLNDLLHARKLDPTLENIDLDLGMAYFKLANHKEAQPILEAVLRKDPSNLVAVLILGKIAAYQGNWDKARGLDEYVVAREPRNADALKDLGTALVALGKDEEALAPLHQALDIRPDMSEAHFQLGKALRSLGRADDARYEMDLYQSIRDRDHSGQTLVSPEKAFQSEHWKECERLLNEAGETAAIAYVDSVSAETQSQWNAFYMVGMVYAALHRNDDAIRLLNKAVQVAPNDADAVAFLGRVYIRVNNSEQGEEDLKRALELSPSNQIALVGMGELQYMKSQWTEAARYFDLSHTQEVSALISMCNAYARAGNQDKAREAAELVRAFAHGDPERIEKLKASACAGDAAEPQEPAHARQ